MLVSHDAMVLPTFTARDRLVGFAYITDAWRKTDTSGYPTVYINTGNAACAFSFFSWLSWVCTGMCVKLALLMCAGAERVFCRPQLQEGALSHGRPAM